MRRGIILASILVFIIMLCNVYSQSSTIYLGRGCTTITYMDYDCDGYVIGGKDGHSGSYSQIAFPAPPNREADANDYDSNINTPQSVTNKYGLFDDINNFKNYLSDLGYNNSKNIFFISQNGNDSSAQPNNINLPYRNFPRLSSYALPENHIIKPGDVVVFRGGNWSAGSLTTFGSYDCTPNPPTCPTAPNCGCSTVDVGIQGNETNPILLINYPGERVIFKDQSGGNIFGTSRNTSYVIIDGFEFDGTDTNNNIVANTIFTLYGPGNHITFRNLELRNAETWGIFGAIDKDRDYYTLDKVSIHHINGQHCIYRNDQATNGTSIEELDTDFGWVIKNSIFYNCRFNGIQWRGGKNFTFEGDIIHTTGLNGIDIKNSPEDGVIKNNLIFNNGHGPILIFEDNDPQRFLANGTNNILITQNIFSARSGINGAGGDNSAFSAIRFTHFTSPPRTHKNVKIYNNIIYSNGAAPIYFDYSLDIENITVEKNIFYRHGYSNPNDLSGMSVSNWTDGTHNASGLLLGLPLYTWNFDSMQNSLRPNIINNILADPLFTDVNNSYTTSFTPWLYNFLPMQNSPGIDFTNSLYSTPYDIRGMSRNGSSDSGAYEYGSPTIWVPNGSTTGSTSGGGTNTGGNSGGSSGGSGGGSGGGGGHSIIGESNNSISGNAIATVQCNDQVDNDGDLLIDYPSDPGCSSILDNVELDSSSLASSETTEKNAMNIQSSNEDVAFRALFLWSILLILFAVSLFIVIIIIRNVKFYNRNKN